MTGSRVNAALCVCFVIIATAVIVQGADGRSRHRQVSSRGQGQGDWAGCRCSNATHCALMMTEESFAKQGIIVARFSKNYKRASAIARHRGGELTATLNRMMVRFTAMFQKGHSQQVENMNAILKRLHRLKERQEYDNPAKFMALARGVNKALARVQTSFNDFVAQVVSDYALINTNVLQLV